MYLINLYTFYRKSNNFHGLVYGFALDVGESNPADWRQYNIDGTSAWKLRCFWSTIDSNQLDNLLDNAKAKGHLVVNKSLITVPKWLQRPVVLLPSRNELHEGKKALTNRMSRARIYYATNKINYFENLFYPNNITSDVVKTTMLKKLEDNIAEESGIRLFSDDSDRFGNMEIYNSLDSGSLLEPSSFHVKVLKKSKNHPDYPCQKEPHAIGIKIWCEDKLKQHMPLLVNASWYSDSSNRRTLLMDEFKQLRCPGQVVTFTCEEPPSFFELKIWSTEGQLLYRSRNPLLRCIQTDIIVNTCSMKVIDSWSKKLPAKYRDTVEGVEPFSKETLYIGGNTFEPWLAECESFSRYLHDIFASNAPCPSKSQFFPGTQEGEVEFFKYLQALLEEAGVKKATFIDPFFGIDAASRILTRISNQHVEAEVITSLVDIQKSEDANSENVKHCEMASFLKQNASLLPDNLKVLNIQNESATEQQFHDRFLLLEKEDGLQGWILGNSYHSQAQRYPAVMVELPNDVLKEVEDYVEGLRSGKVAGRKEARCVVIWDSCNRNKSCNEKNQEILPGNLQGLQGWDEIVDAFSVSASNPREALQKIIDLEYFKSNSQRNSWEVKEEKKNEICSSIKDYTMRLLGSSNPDYNKIDVFFKALAHWIYLGSGFSVKDIIVGGNAVADYMAHVLSSLKDMLSNRINSVALELAHIKAAYERISEEPKSYSECLGLMQYYDVATSLLHENYFFAEYLYLVDFNRYLEELEHNWVLFPHFLNQLIENKISYENLTGQVGSRFAVFSWLAYHLWSENFSETWKNMSIDRDCKVKAFLTYLKTLDINEQEKLLAETAVLIKDSALPDGAVLSFMTDLSYQVAAKLADLLDEFSLSLAQAVRQHTLDSWISRLIVKEEQFVYSVDQKNLKIIAEITAKLYGDNWSEWYINHFLNKLSWKRYNKPLYCFTNFSCWHNDSLRLLLALLFGLVYLERGDLDKDEYREVLIEIKDRFARYLAPHIWQLTYAPYVSYSVSVLDEVIRLLGRLSSEIDDTLCEECLRIVEEQRVPLPRGLVMYLSSNKTFAKRKKRICAVLDSPLLDRWLGEEDSKQLEYIIDLLDMLTNEVPAQDRKIICMMREKLIKY